jgi:hypothetical protein
MSKANGLRGRRMPAAAALLLVVLAYGRTRAAVQNADLCLLGLPQTFTVGPPGTARGHIVPVALGPKGERVLYAGGLDANGVEVLKSAEEFLGFPICAYLPTGDMNVARFGYAAARVSSNNLDPTAQSLVCGGANDDGTLDNCEFYNPLTRSFTMPTPQLTTGRLFPSMTLKSADANTFRATVCTGWADAAATQPLNSCDFISVNKGPLDFLPSLPVDPILDRPRAEASQFELPSGRIFLAGGITDSFGDCTETTIIIDPTQIDQPGFVTPGPSLPVPMARAVSAASSDGTRFVMGYGSCGLEPFVDPVSEVIVCNIDEPSFPALGSSECHTVPNPLRKTNDGGCGTRLDGENSVLFAGLAPLNGPPPGDGNNQFGAVYDIGTGLWRTDVVRQTEDVGSQPCNALHTDNRVFVRAANGDMTVYHSEIPPGILVVTPPAQPQFTPTPFSD